MHTTTDSIEVTTLAGGPGHAVTVRHVRAGGTQREIGATLAAAARQVHGSAADPRPADAFVERLRRRWFATNHPAHAERIKGVADEFGLDPDDTGVSLDWLGTYDLPAGCSVAFYPGAGTKDGHGLLSRNFDFPTATFSQIVGLPPTPGERPLGADPWVVELHPDDGYASVTVGIMDVLGAMDGINEAGLAVALLADNESPEPEPTGGAQVGLSEQQVVRYLLDTCATVEEAKAALLLAKHYYFFTPCHFVVADRSGASFVWEHSPRRNREIILDADDTGPAGGRLVCTNHLLHRWPDPTLLPTDDGPFGTAALTYDRWRSLHQADVGDAVVDRDEIRRRFEAIRFTAPIVEARTFWHALYDVDSAAMEVAFFTHDEGGRSVYSEPLELRLSA
ncbi:MAG TPA: C45 family peptidase [Acidimicrobiales bacterium]